MSKLLHDGVHWLTSRAARAYSAPTIEDTRRICFNLRDQGFGSTVCFWNGDTDTVEHITRSCLQLVELLSNLDDHSYLSLKLPPMQFDKSAVAAILKAAAQVHQRVHFDSHGPEDADRMFATIGGALGHKGHLGCTIPGRWLRSIEDARLAADWGLRVRVVKGQWLDPQKPDLDMRLGFLRIIDELCGRATCVAVASHDVPLAREALCRLLLAGTPCELELLHGLPRRMAVKMGRRLHVPIRFYVPYGKAWLPYLLGQARRNPRVLGWFARDLVLGIRGTDTNFRNPGN
jgi:proline dehydrogenase